MPACRVMSFSDVVRTRTTCHKKRLKRTNSSQLYQTCQQFTFVPNVCFIRHLFLVQFILHDHSCDDVPLNLPETKLVRGLYLSFAEVFGCLLYVCHTCFQRAIFLGTNKLFSRLQNPCSHFLTFPFCNDQICRRRTSYKVDGKKIVSSYYHLEHLICFSFMNILDRSQGNAGRLQQCVVR